MFYLFSVFIQKPQRVDIFLSTLFSDFSRSYIQKIIDRGQVFINNKKITKNIKVNTKDELRIELILISLDLEPENLNLDVVYEDKEIILINKDAGINVHPVPGEGGRKGTLVNGLLYHCESNLPSIGGVERPGIVHRLDKDTSGIMMVAKTDKMMHYLSNIIKERKINKFYFALVNGLVNEKKFKIESYIGRDPNNRLRMTWKNPLNPKIAISYGEVIKYIDNKYTLIKMKIETGRTHQIRVHLLSIGHPILGDKVYGDNNINKIIELKYGLKRQALHAYNLEFDLYGKKVSFIGEVKEDIKKIIS